MPKNLPILLLILALPAALAEPGHLFVFYGEGATSAVYDADSLELIATPLVGRRASQAFAIPNRAAGGVAKFYVVSENAVVILGPDFTVRGSVFLPGAVPGRQNFAALTRDAARFVVASGEQIHILETVNDSIFRSLELGFPAAGVAVSGDSRRAYIISTQSRWVRFVDLESLQLEDLGLELPEFPGAIVTSQDGSRVYVTGWGSIYQLDQTIDGVLKPIVTAPGSPKLSLATSDPGSSEVPAKHSSDPGERIALDGSPLIEDLFVGVDRRFLVRAGGRLLHGVLGPGGPVSEVMASSADATHGTPVDLATSRDGQTLYVVAQGDPQLIKFDVATAKPVQEIALASQPTAVTLAPEPIAQAGTLEKFSGDGQTVQSGSPFALIARAVGGNGSPQEGVVVTVNATVPSNVASCTSPLFPTDANGLAMISCTAGAVTSPTGVSVIVSDNFGRVPSPPFTVTLVPAAPRPSGLQKLQGDGQVVDESSAFPSSLVVSDFVSTVAQTGKTLTISTTPSGLVSCVPAGLTNAQGLGTINCNALSVTATTVVRISVTDSDGRSLAHPFATVVKDSEASITGLSKVSGDNQTVVRNSPFPNSLVVLDRIDGSPRSGATLTVTETPASAVSCDSPVITDSNGLADIDCDALNVTSTTNAQIFVSDNFGEALPQPFNATILVGSPSTEGLTKVSGDNQLVAQGMSLAAPLVVGAVLGGQPQNNLQLTVTSSNQILLFCPVSVFTNSNGLASFSCSAGTVGAPTIVNVTVRDNLGRSVIFSVTIVPTNPADVDNLVLTSDDSLEVQVRETLDDGIRLRAVDSDGEGVPGVAVFYSSTRDVTFDPPASITNLNGDTRTSPTFGCFVGSGTIRIGLEPGDSLETVRFTASAGPPTLLTKTQGDNQTGSPGETLSQTALVATVSDDCGNPIRGERVTWAVNPPEAATLLNVISTSDRNGRTSVVVRLGNRPGPFTVTARSGQLTAVFNLTVNVTATQMRLISGSNQTVALGAVATLPLIVEVQDDQNRPVPGVQVVFAVTQGSATLTTDPSVISDSVGRAQVFVRAGNALGTIQVVATAVGRTITFTITTIGRVPAVTTVGFVNGANFRQGWVPGSTGTIFGVGLMEGVTGVVEAGQVPFPTILLGVRVTVNGMNAPILSLANINGQEQINIQVPFGLSAPGVATVTIDNNGSLASFAGVLLFSVQPAIFEVTVEGVRIAAALHADFSLVTPSNPARPGETILLFLTGLGRTSPNVGTNVLGPVPPAVSVVNPVVGLDDRGQRVLGSFYAPGLVTVFQINFEVSDNAQPGMRKLSVVAGSSSSQNTVLPVGQ